MIDFLIRARFVGLGLIVAIMAVLLLMDRHVRYEQSIQSFFAEDDPAVVSYREAARLFGNDQLVFLVYEDPELITAGGMDRIAELGAAIGPDRIDGVVRVESLDAMPALWKVEENFLALNGVDQRIEKLGDTMAGRLAKSTRDRLWSALKTRAASPNAVGGLSVAAQVRSADEAGLAEIADKLVRNPLYSGTVIGKDAKTTALVANLKAPDDHDVKRTVRELRTISAEFAQKHGLGRPAVVGPPVLLADGFEAIELDGQRLALAGMILIGLVMLVATRSVWWAMVPMLAGWAVWLATDTTLALLDVRLSLSGGPLVAQIIVLTMPAASHLALHFLDDLRRAEGRREAARETLASVSRPILWCALAGAIGYGALMTSNVVPVRQFGAVLAACTAIGSLLTLAISPNAMLPLFPMEWPIRRGSKSYAGSWMNHLTGWVVAHPAWVVLGSLAAVIPLALGISRLSYESNYINAFKPGAAVVRDYFAAESKLGGIGLVSLLVPLKGPVDHGKLAELAGLEKALRELPPLPDGSPSISQVVSMATVLDPDGVVAGLDEASQDRILAAKLELIEASPQSELLKGFWNKPEGAARLLVRVLEGQQARTKEATFDRAQEEARKRFGPEAKLTGLSHLLTRTTAGVIATQWTTFFWSTASLLVVLTIAFRGPGLAVLAMLPTLLAVTMVLGLMGWLGIKLDIATALVGSVALGLSVDDTFHCLLQYGRLRKTMSFREALFSSYSVSGPGVLLSSLAVAVGFSVLRFSQFVPFSNFGGMVAIATLGSSLGNVALLPACLALGHRITSRDRS
ncbi:MAG: MMPL family transporter [Isosphaeraceae bacterium]